MRGAVYEWLAQSPVWVGVRRATVSQTLCGGPVKSGWLAAAQAHGLSQPMAKLYFHYSTMNAGKSTSLLQASHNYREGGMTTYLITAQFDNRAGQGRIASRIGIGEAADTFGPDEDLYAKLKARFDQGRIACVFIDEAQFLSKAQVWELACAVDDLGVPVMCYGLRVDFKGDLFPGSAALLAWADEMREVRTICHCGKKATMVIRRGPDGRAVRDGEQVVIGGNQTYVSLCRRHWREAVAER
jgi:thymidine kinase